MAEGLLRHDGGEAFAVASAGIEPSFVRPEAIEVMREIGIDISNHRSAFRAVRDEFRERLREFIVLAKESRGQEK